MFKTIKIKKGTYPPYRKYVMIYDSDKLSQKVAEKYAKQLHQSANAIILFESRYNGIVAKMVEQANKGVEINEDNS